MEMGRLMLPSTHHQLSFTNNSTLLLHSSPTQAVSCVEFHDQLRFPSSSWWWRGTVTFKHPKLEVTVSGTNRIVDWDNLGFNDFVPAEYMYMSKCHGGSTEFSDGQLQPFSNIQLNPFSAVLNYGQGAIEGLKAYKREDESILLFRPEQNAMRMRVGAERLCMPAPSIDHFVEAVKATVLANKEWIPHPSKGFLYVRPVIFGDGPVLSLTPSSEFTFLIYVSPAPNFFEGNSVTIDLVIKNGIHRAVLGGAGNINAIGNYAAVMSLQAAAKEQGFHDVLYLDSECNRYLEQISAANIFIVKDNIICSPALRSTILPGITRQSIIEIARREGFQVEERLVSAEELFEANEVFCTANSVGVLSVGSITYQGKRISYKGCGLGAVSQKLNAVLTDTQMSHTEDKMGWTVVLN